MSYTPTTWTTGDTITASAMNKIENGIASAGGGGLVTVENGTLDKNFNELKAMVESGIAPFIISVFDDSPEIYTRALSVGCLWTDGSSWSATFGCVDLGGQIYSEAYVASSATGTLVLD